MMYFIKINDTSLLVAIFVNSTYLEGTSLRIPYYIFIVIECFLQLLALCNLPILMGILIRSNHLHLNLRVIYIGMIFLAMVTIVSRYFIILFQFGFFSRKTHTELILLVIVSSTRIQPILYEVFFCFSVFVERLVATRKLAVYEKSKYWPLSTLLILLNTLVSIICTYAIIYYLYDHYFLILFIFFPIIAFIALFSFWCLHQLYLWNHRELQTMTSFVEVKNFHEKTYANDAYLSRRFQLTENIEVLKLMHTIFKVHSVCSLVGVFLSGIPMVFLDFNTEIAQMMLVFFDLVIIVAIITHIALMVLWIESYRRDYFAFLSIFGLSFFKTSKISPVKKINAEETKNTYFSIYDKIWA